MSLHLTERQLERCRRGELSRDERAALYEHVAGCADCERAVSASADLSGRFNFFVNELRDADEDRSPHLSYEEREGFVDGRLDPTDREIVETHLGVCASCAAEVESLNAFRVSLAAPAIAAAPAVAAAAAAASGRRTYRPRFFERWATLLTAPGESPRRGARYAWAAALGFLLIAAGAATTWLLTRGEESRLAASQTVPQLATIRRAEPQTAAPPIDVAPTTPNVVGPPNDPAPRIETPDAGRGFSAPRLELRDGGRVVTLTRAGDVRGLPPSLAAPTRQAVRLALATESLREPAPLRSLASQPMRLLDDPAAAKAGGAQFAPLGPVGTIVASDRPVFRWRPHADAVSYAVTVVDRAGRVVAQSEQLSSIVWTAQAPLARGATYAWQVAAHMPDGSVVRSPAPPARPARFGVVGGDVEREANALGRLDSPLALGIFYAERGLKEEAAREFEKLLRANPDSRVARRLLRAVQSW